MLDFKLQILLENIIFSPFENLECLPLRMFGSLTSCPEFSTTAVVETTYAFCAFLSLSEIVLVDCHADFGTFTNKPEF
jgi:hypothetical protein